MAIEYACFRSRRGRLTGLHSIPAGDSMRMDLAGERVTIAISSISGADGDQGSVLVGGNVRKIRAFVYNKGSNERKRITASGPFAITEGKILSIEIKKHKPKPQVLIYSSM